MHMIKLRFGAMAGVRSAVTTSSVVLCRLSIEVEQSGGGQMRADEEQEAIFLRGKSALSKV